VYWCGYLLVEPIIMKIIGPRKIGTFLMEWVRRHGARRRLKSACARMAKDKERETEAWEWAEVVFRDAANETA
jgi:hypothetical protein